ncbi:hypothetical protein [Litoreibacter roseus]|uniref:Uncharacterized protein n=1 Tax=Litoreibacter roseus TaxID=2601869 RepID=A0A6N6JGF2_9RHOB|nr:hypothetical protein [Litoreibacter roseus]GFE64368.1 hypothetical protein KIN_14420 [Litoreibacter roseus]
MEDYEGLDFASWSRRIIREQSGRDPSDDFREVEQLVRETDGLSMKLSGGFSHSDAQEAHQETKYALQELRDVARRGWATSKEAILESSVGQAVVTAVEKLARFLKRERVANEKSMRTANDVVVKSDTYAQNEPKKKASNMNVPAVPLSKFQP